MIRLLEGDCRTTLPTLAAGSVQACITSPPYYGLRSYIEDGDPLKSFEIGLEPTPDLYIEHMVEVFRKVRRVLRDDGCVFLNLGDSYAGKNLLMMPFRVAMALQADGWWLRSVIPWLKRNAMPESVTDRPATSVEYVFLLGKSARYYWDADAVRMPSDPARTRFTPGKKFEEVHDTTGRDVRNDGLARLGQRMNDGEATGRNRRNGDWFFESWQGLMTDEQDDPLALVVNPQPFKGSHFATFPPKLVVPMVKASTSERGQCRECGAPWVRMTETEYVKSPVHGEGSQMRNRAETTEVNGWAGMPRVARRDTTTGWRPTCKHDAEPVPQTILDPFAGAATTLIVADRLGRNGIGCELKPSYAEMGTARIVGDSPMFVELAAD